MSAKGTHSFDEARADRSHWGRLVESAVGAHLVNSAEGDTRIHYWREGSLEVDFVIEHRGKLVAVEVKSGKTSSGHRGLAEFARRHDGCSILLVGSDELPVGEFLRYPAAHANPQPRMVAESRVTDARPVLDSAKPRAADWLVPACSANPRSSQYSTCPMGGKAAAPRT